MMSFAVLVACSTALMVQAMPPGGRPQMQGGIRPQQQGGSTGQQQQGGPPQGGQMQSGRPEMQGGNTNGGQMQGGNTGQQGGRPGGATASTSSHAASLLGDVAKTTVTGTDARSGKKFPVGENIYGPFEAGFTSRQNGILERLGCADGNDGHVAGGIDTHTAEQMVAAQCGITLPRVEGDSYISLIDECGGHTNEYHFHERMSCLFKAEGGHSTKVGEAMDGQDLFGKWEDFAAESLPELDACGGHYGVTPDSNGKSVYHYHVQDAAPFTMGCFGPNDDKSLVTVAQCRDFYPGCDGDLVDVRQPGGSKQYDLWCPCFDANGSNTGVEIAELAVFSGDKATDKATAKAATEKPATKVPTKAATKATKATEATKTATKTPPAAASSTCADKKASFCDKRLGSKKEKQVAKICMRTNIKKKCQASCGLC